MKVFVKDALRKYAELYETADFLEGDPSWFMHQVTGSRNQEVMAFIASALSYGSRKQFMPKIEYLLDASARQPYEWLVNGSYTSHIPDDSACYYRLYTNHKMYGFLEVLRSLYQEYGSMADFVSERVQGHDASDSGLIALKSISGYFHSRGISGIVPQYGSSCKRLCMFLRWMCRDHSPVDLGLWSSLIDKRSLYIPLDTHVLKVSQSIGLIPHRSPGWSTVVLLTNALKKVFPDDPMKGDFALFGYGIHEDGLKKNVTDKKR